MRIIKLSDIIISIQPELAEEIIKNRLSKEYLCWLIIKKLDEKISDGGGKINKQRLIDKLIKIIGHSRYTISRYLKNGESIFWRLDKHNKNILYLNSFHKVCLSLDLKNIYSDKIIYDLSLLEEGFDKCCKSLLIAAIASKQNNPVSNINLAGRCHMCKRTIQNHLNNAENNLDIIHKMQNYLWISMHNNLTEANDIKEKLINDGKYPYGSLKIKNINNEYWLLKQIPSSIINKTGRASSKNDKISLKQKNGYINFTKHKAIYTKPNIGKTGIQYFCSFFEKNGELLNNISEIANINIYVERGTGE